MIRKVLRRTVSDYHFSRMRKLKLMPGSYFPNQGKVSREQTEFGPAPVYPDYDIDGTNVGERKMENTQTLMGYFGLKARQFALKMEEANAEIAEKEKRTGKLLNGHLVNLLLDTLNTKNEEQRLALSKYAADARLSEDPIIKIKGYYIEYALQKVREDEKKVNKETKGERKYFSRAKINLRLFRKERKKPKELFAPEEDEYLHSKMKTLNGIKHMINRSEMLYSSEDIVKKIAGIKHEVDKIDMAGMTILDPHEAFVYKNAFKEGFLQKEGRLEIPDEILYGKDVAEQIKQRKKERFFGLHRTLSSGITPLELLSNNYSDETDIVGNRVQKDASALARTFASMQESIYENAMEKNYRLKRIPREMEELTKPEEVAPKLPPKTGEYYSLADVTEILANFVYDEIDHHRIPPPLFDSFPAKSFTNDFRKWSRALGLYPIEPSNSSYKSRYDPNKGQNLRSQRRRLRKK